VSTSDPGTGAPANPWERWGWALAAIWLVFLVYPVIETAQTDAPQPAKLLTWVLLAGFAVVYVLGYTRWSDRGLAVAAALLLIALATVPVLGVETVGLTPYLGAYSALQVPRPWWPWTTVVSALLPLFSLIGGEQFPLFFFLMVWPIIAACVLIRLFDEKLEERRAVAAELALVAERDRVARDVHDVLGHSLTALSVKAELASRLIDVDPARARAELESIQETARQALAEVRSTVGGLRAGNLEAELAAAPRVLADVGVTTRVVGDVADTDPRQRAMLAWVLRESVTNVVRHAHATAVTIELGRDGLSVTDDGAGPGDHEGNGLRGMRERVAAAGGTLDLVDARPGTRVRVAL
jgi:two-component system sensor histidine kinase DesK